MRSKGRISILPALNVGVPKNQTGQFKSWRVYLWAYSTILSSFDGLVRPGTPVDC
jgi:hypothetical protein